MESTCISFVNFERTTNSTRKELTKTRQMQSQRGNGAEEALTVLKGYWLYLRGVKVALVLLLSYRFFSFSFLPSLSMVM